MLTVMIRQDALKGETISIVFDLDQIAYRILKVIKLDYLFQIHIGPFMAYTR